MKASCLFFLFVVAIACSEVKNDDSYDVPMLSEKINAFINAKKCFGETRDILFVNLDVQNDTLYIDIANTYPNLKGMEFVCDTTICGVRTLFLGKKIKGFYKKSSNNNFPPDIVEINKNQRWLLEREFTNWYFVYYKGTLIRKSLGCDADALAK